MVASVVEDAAERLASMPSSVPRKRRRAVQERSEATMDVVDVPWAERVSQCSEDVLEQLEAALAGMTEVGASGTGFVVQVLKVLECVDRCSVVVQAAVLARIGSACMAVVTLGCPNGFAVCENVGENVRVHGSSGCCSGSGTTSRE